MNTVREEMSEADLLLGALTFYVKRNWKLLRPCWRCRLPRPFRCAHLSLADFGDDWRRIEKRIDQYFERRHAA